MIRRVILLISLLGLMFGPRTSFASSRELPDSTPRVTLTQNGLRVVWNAINPEVFQDAEGKTHIKVPGFEVLDSPGVPLLPVSSILVAIPPESTPEISILNSAWTEDSLPSPLALGKQPAGVERDTYGDVIGGAYIPTSKEISSPDQVVSFESIGVVRGIHLARLSFFPVIQENDSIRITSAVEVEVNFGPILQSAALTSTISDPVQVLVRAAVVNPEQVQIIAGNKLLLEPHAALQLASDTVLAVDVASRGITDISGAEVAATGIPVSPFDRSKLTLSRNGSNIAYQWLGNNDNVFEPTEKIRIFADPRFSRWTTTDTYLLDLNGPGGTLMSSYNADPGSKPLGTAWVELTFEENNIYTPSCYCAPIPAGRDEDRWVGYQFQRPGVSSQEIPFELPGFDRTINANIRIWLIGYTDINPNPDHKIEAAIKVYVNNIEIQEVPIGTIQFNGKSRHEANLIIPNSLEDGDYRLVLSIPSDTPGDPVDGVWLDAFSIRYALDDSISAGASFAFDASEANHSYSVRPATNTGLAAFEISDPENPRALIGISTSSLPITIGNDGQSHSYWISTSSGIESAVEVRRLKSLSVSPSFTGADYVIISPAEFIPSLNPLVAMHKNNGLDVIVQDVQAIYDTYAGGRPLPTAIRDYLADAYHNWKPQPLYVLLVGDGTHDPKNYRPTSSETYIPPFLEDVDPWAGETAADNRYVTVDGSDNLPDMLIGRLPANILPESQNPFIELDTMVSKIVAYAQKPAPEFWQHQALFVADDQDFGGGNFPLLSDSVINKVSSNSLGAQRLYYSPADAPTAFRSLLNQIWDQGNSLIMFTGHSSIHQWAHEIVFHLEDIPGLDNAGRLPVVLEMTCFTGSFQIHDFPTLDEALLREPGGGAIAVWGATGLGISTGHHWLAEGFMDTIYEDGISEIGKAALAGKINLASTGKNSDLIDTFTLFGDPATQLERSYRIYAPLSNH